MGHPKGLPPPPPPLLSPTSVEKQRQLAPFQTSISGSLNSGNVSSSLKAAAEAETSNLNIKLPQQETPVPKAKMKTINWNKIPNNKVRFLLVNVKHYHI
jgi:hypothetical protein